MIGRALGLALLVLSLAAATAGAATPRASLTTIENEVMCVTCGVPLSIADSPQADHERAFIRGLIARGETEPQILQALVAQLGPNVLGLPGRHGFDLAVYIVPVALIALLAGMLAVGLPRWRRRGRPPPAAGDPGSDEELDRLSADEESRLDAELARYAG